MKRYIGAAIDFDIEEDDAEIVQQNNKSMLKNAVKVEYDDGEAEDSGYDGGYKVTYKDGSIKFFGWLERNAAKGIYTVYPVTVNSNLNSNEASFATVSEVINELSKYNSEMPIVIQTGTDDAWQIGKILQRAVLDDYGTDADAIIISGAYPMGKI